VHPVVVVGAGPAGCAAALCLARQGIEVRLLEAARFPRDKVCGDVLLPEARDVLEQMGISTSLFASRRHLITGCRYVTPSGRVLEAEFRDLEGRPRPWWSLRRIEIDQVLVDQVRAAGVAVEEGVRARGLLVEGGAIVGVTARDAAGDTIEVRASAVIAADGASSVLARRAGLHGQPTTHLCVSQRGYVDAGAAGEASLFSIFTTARTLPGCTWCVPLGAGRANVGVGVLRADLDRRGGSLSTLADEAAARHPEFAQVWSPRPALRGWSLPGASWPRRRTRPGLLLVGDAGGMVDPFTGHGIHTALRAGRLAGEVLARALARGEVGLDALAPFELAWQRDFALEARLGWLLQRLCASPWRVEALVRYVDGGARRRALVGGLVGHAFPRQALLSPASWIGRRGGRAREEGAG
jgi:geranylgeranyl reductase family protein